jgi:NADH-quinone oxidoreductase subunit N
MSFPDVVSLLPLLVLSAAILSVMLFIAFRRSHRFTYFLSIAGLVLAMAVLPLAVPTLPRPVTPLLMVDAFAIFYMGLIIAGSLVVALISYNYMENVAGNKEEYYLLILLATLGACTLVISNHFISFFLGLEILSISLFTMIAYTRFQRHRVEAAIKYLVLAAAASAFLLFGMALMYMVFGTMQFNMMRSPAGLPPAENILLAIGFSLIMVAIGFKLALVPFQLWAPDVYQGAPAPVTAFVATVSKGGILAIMLRLFSNVPLQSGGALWNVIALIAVASMLLGNILAVTQTNVKRILAYSSIAQFGYLLVAFLAGTAFGTSSMTFFLVVYIVTTLLAFGVITFLSHPNHEFEELESYRGLYQRRPAFALFLSLSLLSLASLPPTGGLIGKVMLAGAGVQSALWIPLAALVVGSVIGIFYYLRIVITMFRQMENTSFNAEPAIGGSTLILAVLGIVLVILGIYPGPLIQIIERAMTGFG